MPPLILITRPKDSATNFEAALKAHLGQDTPTLIAPLMDIQRADPLPPLDGIRTIIFSSAHAVRYFAQTTSRRDFACYTVGPATTQIASDVGFAPIEGPGTAQGLSEQIIADRPEQPCLYLRGEHVAFDIKVALENAGIEMQSAVLYRQVTVPLDTKAQRRITAATSLIVPLFSPRSARLFFDAMPDTPPLHIGAISEAVADMVPVGRASSLAMATHPDTASMLTCLEALWRAANPLEGGAPAQ